VIEPSTRTLYTFVSNEGQKKNKKQKTTKTKLKTWL